MNNPFTINLRAFKRVACTMLAALLVVAGLPFMNPARVSASTTQLSSRSIQLSDSAASGTSVTAGVGSGVNVTYRVTINVTNAAASLVIDFCDGSTGPIVNDTCTAPTGMTAATGFGAVVGNVTPASSFWSLTSSANQVKLANDGNAAHDIAANSQQIFDVTGITNPSTTGTFFARIYTYSNNSWGAYSSPTAVNLGANSDYGGIALSITSVISITARVQESLTFCVSKADPTTWTTTHDCGDTVVGSNLPAVTLGHTLGGSTLVLEPSQVDRSTIYSQLSTNATHGALITLRSNPGGSGTNSTCGGLSADAGTTCAIPPIGSAAAAIVAGTADFGLFVSNSYLDAASGAATGTITPHPTYHNAAHVDEITPDLWYGMDNTTATAANGTIPSTYSGNVSGTFGSEVGNATGPVYRVENNYVFAATAALTTPAGIYTANMSMTATGTF